MKNHSLFGQLYHLNNRDKSDFKLAVQPYAITIIKRLHLLKKCMLLNYHNETITKVQSIAHVNTIHQQN